MTEYHVDLRLTFHGIPDEWDEGYEVIDITTIEQLRSNLPEDNTFEIVEKLAQSDIRYVGLPMAILAAIEGGCHQVDKTIC